MTLLILALLSVGSLLVFGKMAQRDARGRLMAIDGYGPAHLALALLLAALNIYSGYVQFTGPATVVTVQLLVVNIVFVLLVLFFVLGMIMILGLNPVEIFGLWGRKPGLVLGVAVLGLVALLPPVALTQQVMQVVLGPTHQQPLLDFLQQKSGTSDRLLLILTAVVLAPLSEELIFRGYLYGVFRKYIGRWAALLVSAGLFAFCHGHAPSLAGLFVLAITLTLAYEYTGSLWTNMLMHAGFNTIEIINAIYWPGSN